MKKTDLECNSEEKVDIHQSTGIKNTQMKQLKITLHSNGTTSVMSGQLQKLVCL